MKPIDIRTAFPPAALFNSVGDLLSAIVYFAISAAGLVFFFLLIWGGIKIMTAQGDEKAMAAGRQTLTDAAIGLLIIIASFIIITIILQVFAPGISVKPF